jgi:hypothetical protein
MCEPQSADAGEGQSLRVADESPPLLSAEREWVLDESSTVGATTG